MYFFIIVFFFISVGVWFGLLFSGCVSAGTSVEFFRIRVPFGIKLDFDVHLSYMGRLINSIT